MKNYCSNADSGCVTQKLTHMLSAHVCTFALDGVKNVTNRPTNERTNKTFLEVGFWLVFSYCVIRRNKRAPCVAVLKPVVSGGPQFGRLYIVAARGSCAAAAQQLPVLAQTPATLLLCRDARASDNAHLGAGVIEAGIGT